MLGLLWLIPFAPLAGFLVLVLTEGRLAPRYVSWVGVGSIGIAALLTGLVGVTFLSSSMEPYTQVLWTWMSIGSFAPQIAFYLDALSLNMMFVITGVGFLIHVYSVGYMRGDPGFSRFFAYMNLFVFAMLILVLADNLVLLFLGWEGVGLCSYLLIGFWYDNPENGYAARKAFVVTRVGDTAMALGLFLLFKHLNTLEIQPLMERASENWEVGSTLAVVTALLLLGGAVGKSAQLPLQTWLPDAMAGPTPVSALIHAATMVTAGVYLIARTHVLFTLAPDVQLAVGVVGAATLLISGVTALTQTDIKRVLAYSTISQVGYMFLALGVGAWSAAIFHLMTHAFFKALLFMAAGAVILAMHHEQDIFKMGGLWRRLPVAFWTFLIGTCALVALPLTAGYFSKHEILLTAFDNGPSGVGLWAAGIIGALLTAVYSSKLVLIVFFGPENTKITEKLDINLHVPLVILAVLSLFGALLRLPLDSVLPEPVQAEEVAGWAEWLTNTLPPLGIVIAFLVYGTHSISLEPWSAKPIAQRLQRFWFDGWGLDWLYDRLLVQPYCALARLNRRDVVDFLYIGLAAVIRLCHRLTSRSQTGQLRWYAASMLLGTLFVIAIGLFA